MFYVDRKGGPKIPTHIDLVVDRRSRGVVEQIDENEIL